MKQRRKFSPNKYRKSNWFERWRHAEQHLNTTTIEEALNPEKVTFLFQTSTADWILNWLN